jgi:hypothetical protein
LAARHCRHRCTEGEADRDSGAAHGRDLASERAGFGASPARLRLAHRDLTPGHVVARPLFAFGRPIATRGNAPRPEEWLVIE